MTSIIKADADNDTILLLLSRTKRIRIPHGLSVRLFTNPLTIIISQPAQSAVKFIRDQANATLAVQKEEEHVKDRVGHTAQMAATALRKTYAILKGDTSAKISVDLTPERNTEVPGEIDPLDGWAEGVSLRKSDCCLLLKAQIVLRGETPADSCVVAAAQAKLQSFNIMDDFNLDDPISGKVMSRPVKFFMIWKVI